ncbi:MAG: aminoacyl-tRNA hydrolase [Clostridia bacterium]|nr:aminoacyl-tRNA hydrolase [Clostridia bacterium]
MKETYLIVGLGNIGPKYAHTRHNAGFDVMERIEQKLGVRLRKKLFFPGEIAETADGEKKIVLCRPTTFMNKSGECVRQLLRKYQCPPERMIVIYDDIDLPPGKVRIRKDGGAGTHNGMRSIVECIGKTGFPRIRVGTGDRPAGEDLVKWVLGRYTPEEKVVMDAAFDRAAESALCWVKDGIDAAMNAGNRK